MLLALLAGGCSTLESISPWSGRRSDLEKKEDAGAVPVEELYNRGVDALGAQKYDTAVSQFDAVEQNYPYSSWAVNAQLM